MRLTTNTFRANGSGAPPSAAVNFQIRHGIGDASALVFLSGSRRDDHGDGEAMGYGNRSGNGDGLGMFHGRLMGGEYMHQLIVDWWRRKP